MSEYILVAVESDDDTVEIAQRVEAMILGYYDCPVAAAIVNGVDYTQSCGMIDVRGWTTMQAAERLFGVGEKG